MYLSEQVSGKEYLNKRWHKTRGNGAGVSMSGKVAVRQASVGCGRRERAGLGVLLREMDLSSTMKKITEK